MTEGAFFQDLAMLMAVAGVVATVFARLGWPKVLGYIFAGVLMGEYTWGGSFLVEANTIRTIGQLGVVFLMFAMGLSFSTGDMKKLKGVALPCAVLDTVVMIWLGYTLGVRVFGWTPVQSMFLGVAICDSATTLLAKVIGEMGWSNRPFCKYVLGTSVCEDIICVGAIAVVTGFASGGGMSASALSTSLGKLAVFFLVVLVFGLICVPRLLKSVGKHDDEALLLTILGCCFFVSYWAYRFQLSLALGAFLVGFIGASSVVRTRIGRLVDPLKSMFSAMFFVSIGLQVDPAACLHHLPAILLVSLVIMVGKFANITSASLLAGLDVKTAVQNGFGLAQIGEFAFMVAILYANLVNSPTNPMFQIVVGASLLTTILNPWMIRISDRAGDFAERRLPERFRRTLADYSGWLQKLGSSRGNPAFGQLKQAIMRLGICAVLMFAVSAVCYYLRRYDYTRFSAFFEAHDQLIFFVIANCFSVSMLPPIIFLARRAGNALCALLFGEGGEVKWMQPVRHFVRLLALVGVMVLFFMEWGMLNVSLAPGGKLVFWVTVSLVLLVGLLGWRVLVKLNRRAIARLQESLSTGNRQEKLGQMMSVQVPEGTFVRMRLGADSPAVGGTVVTLDIRARTGASVVSVVRGEHIYRNVSPALVFAAGDELVAIGEREQLEALRKLVSAKEI